MSGASRDLDVAAILDRQELGPVHWSAFLISFALILLDGYDVLCIAYVGPVLQAEWSLTPAELGPLFASAVVGSAIGPLIFGSAADRFGRRPIILAGAVWFGFFTLLSPLAQDVWHLTAFRFVAGLGMGAVISIISAYVAEFAPKRMRATAIIAVYLGILLGGALGAAIASQTLKPFGWQSIFVFGGIAPLVVAAIGAFWLPESPRFLALDTSKPARLAHLLNRMEASLGANPTDKFYLSDEAPRDGAPLSALFEGRLALMTPLLWVLNSLALLAFYFVVQWSPILLTELGASPETTPLATGAFQVFGLFASLAVMRWVERTGFVPVPILFALSVPVIAAIGIAGIPVVANIALVGFAGFCVAGIQMSAVATQSQVYPTAVRALGVGACFAAGRFGAVLGSAAAGLILPLGFSIGEVFHLFGLLMGVGVLCGVLMVPLYRQQVGQAPRLQGNDARDVAKARI